MGFLCERFGCAPDKFGLDTHDPRVVRTIRVMLDIYHTYQARQQSKSTMKWDNANPVGKKLLAWARGGETNKPSPLEVRITVPERPITNNAR